MRTKTLYFLLAAVLLMGVASCVDNDVKDGDDANFYSATKKTAAQLLADNPERYSLYMELLQRAKPMIPGDDNVSDYFSMLATYGTYTVFAPDNDAMRAYLAEGGYASIQDIPEKTCDTIVRNHIVDKGAYFTTDYSDGTLPAMNMDDRYVVITSDSDKNNNNALLLYVNKRSLITHKDDSVTNGVVHTINRVMSASNMYLPDLMEEDSTISIFCQALQLTNMADSLTKYIDYTYSVSPDSVTKGVPGIRFGGKDMTAYYKEKRFFKYTAFVETNDVLKKYGITSLEDLIARAKKVYDATFPNDAGLYDDDYTNRKNPLNRWVSYHLMNRLGNYSDWAPYGQILTDCCRTDVADAEDFWQTMLNEGMIRFCRAAGDLYANRKGLKNIVSQGLKGVRVLGESESGSTNQQALNGRYFYIEDLLEYSTTVRDKVLNCRMRIDATTLSADFMNQGSRGNLGWDEMYLFAHKRGYIEGWKISPETFVGVHCDNVWWSSYLGNAVAVKGQYDVQIKLPNPPPGLYEIRLAYVAGEERGVVQVYLNNEPCGIPVDLRKGTWEFIDFNDYDLDTEEDNRIVDKTLRNLGYMLGPDSYGKPGAISFRVDAREHVRRILTTAQFTEGKDYWLRFRQVLEGNAEWSFDYLELCPKSVYASPAGENRH